MKTIIYIGGMLPDKDASALRIMANAKALRDFGYNVVLIGETSEEAKCGGAIFVDEFKTYFILKPRGLSEWMKELSSIKKYVKIIEENQNIQAVIMYNPHAFVYEKMVKYCRERNISVVTDCTEWHTVYHLRGLKKLVKKYDITRRMNYSIAKGDGVIAISSFFAKKYNDSCKVVRIPPLVDSKDIKWNHESKHFVNHFVYAGRMGIGKDSLNDCIDAFYQNRDSDFKFDIVGVSYDEYAKQFPNEVSKISELSNKIIFHGFVSHQEAINFVKDANYSFLIRESNRKNNSGFPTKFVESIACGTPVIATEFSDVRQYVEKYNLGIVIEKMDDLPKTINNLIGRSKEEYLKVFGDIENSKIFDYRNYCNILGEFISSLKYENKE